MTKPPPRLLSAARRWCEDGHGCHQAAAANSAVIVRLDRTIQYSARFRFTCERSRLLDTRFRGYDDRCRHDEREIDRNTTMNQPASAYFMEERHDPNEAHTLSVLVQNEPGVLARVIGLFSGRGYNIESLTVSETENQKHVSRITIVTTGTPMVIEQIKHQLDRMVPVYRVVDMTLSGRSIERELAMVKLRGTGEHRVEALRLAEAFRARVIDATTESFVFEITGNSAKINQFIDLMRPLGLVEVSRTGVAAIGRGPEGM
jgi:acetolactate synthase I/III small subunit